MQNLYDHWKTDFIVDKYKDIEFCSKRFRSEAYFLEKVMKPKMKVLDVGCATGGLYHWIKKRFENIDYVGIDISEPLIERAKQSAPEADFILGNILKDKNILQKNEFNLVVATGLFQHEPRYEELLNEMFKYAKDGGYVLFDIKLFHSHPTICDIKKAYGDHGNHKVYYIILNFKDSMKFVLNQSNTGDNIEFYGYYSGSHLTVRLPSSLKEEVLSAHILLQKSQRKREEQASLHLNFPEKFISQICLK